MKHNAGIIGGIHWNIIAQPLPKIITYHSVRLLSAKALNNRPD